MVSRRHTTNKLKECKRFLAINGFEFQFRAISTKATPALRNFCKFQTNLFEFQQWKFWDQNRGCWAEHYYNASIQSDKLY